MTREEMIQQDAKAYTEHLRDLCEGYEPSYQSIQETFIEGVKWADDNPVNPWISVEERLPKEGKDVFVRKVCTNGIFHLVGKVLNGGKWYCYGFGWQDADAITHWMPIPSLKGDEV